MIALSILPILVMAGASVAASTADFALLNRCGPNALRVCALHAGRDTASSEIDAVIPYDGREASLQQLSSAASEFGLYTLAIRWDHDPPAFSDTPGIAPVVDLQSKRHFVAILECRAGQALVLDFPAPPIWVPIAVLRQKLHWDGHLLHLSRDKASLEKLRNESRWWLAPAGGSIATIGALFIAIGLLRRCRDRQRPAASRGPSRIASTSATGRNGFTVVELLICLALIGVLMALILPAIQASRESSRRLECQSRLKSLMQAATAHHAALGKFPGSLIGRGNPTAGGPEINLSVHYALLAYLDQQPLRDSIDSSEDGLGATSEPPFSTKNAAALKARVRVFECPSDLVAPGGTSYRVSSGTSPAMFATFGHSEPEAMPGVVSYRGTRDGEFRDGLSNTVFFSERVVGDQDPNRYTSWRDVFYAGGAIMLPSDGERVCRLPADIVNPKHNSYSGGSWLFSGPENTWYNHIRTPNSPMPDCQPVPGAGGVVTARSAHSGGVNVAFGDGSVRFIADGVDLTTWRALATRSGSEVARSNY